MVVEEWSASVQGFCINRNILNLSNLPSVWKYLSRNIWAVPYKAFNDFFISICDWLTVCATRDKSCDLLAFGCTTVAFFAGR